MFAKRIYFAADNTETRNQEKGVIALKCWIFIVTLVGLLAYVSSGCTSNMLPVDPTDVSSDVDPPEESIFTTGTAPTIWTDRETPDYCTPGETDNLNEYDFSDYNPYGLWEIVDSIQAMPQVAPQEVEPWPLEPLRNGQQLLITESVFKLDGYEGYHNGEPDVFEYIIMKHEIVDKDYFWHFRLTPEADDWVLKNLPRRAVSVRFFKDDAYIIFDVAEREIYFDGLDTILYSDFYYFYRLDRVVAATGPGQVGAD